MLYIPPTYTMLCVSYISIKLEKGEKNDSVEKGTTLQGCPAMKQNCAYEGPGGECSVKAVTCHGFPLGRPRDHFISGTAEVWRGPVTYPRSPKWCSQDLSPGPSLKAKFFPLPAPFSEPSLAAGLSSEAPVSGVRRLLLSMVFV